MGKIFTPVGREENVEIFRLESDPFGTNAYLLSCEAENECILVDAPGHFTEVVNTVDGKKVLSIVITHGHMDHTMALEELYGALGAPLAAHEGDTDMLPSKPDRFLSDGDLLTCGRAKIRVLHTPGHTPGSICLQIGSHLISGDTIFPGGPGKTATPADFKQIYRSIKEKILVLADETIILPGHGESTTIGAERKLIEAFEARNTDQALCGDVTWG